MNYDYFMHKLNYFYSKLHMYIVYSLSSLSNLSLDIFVYGKNDFAEVFKNLVWTIK